VDEDCVVGAVYTSTGCCTRRCGVALNADFVASDPCTTADPDSDPVPASCSDGCTPCPVADPRCEVVHGTVCVGGACTLVHDNGPCATDDDCLVGIDYLSTLGACCDCPIPTSRETLEHQACIVPFGDPKPSGCNIDPPETCDLIGCPQDCDEPTTSCADARCGG
jgi:hypothetical protein